MSKTHTLKSLTSKIGSGATPRGGAKVYKRTGTALIRSQNVGDFQFLQDGLAFIDDVHARALDNVEVHENDILLNITGDSIARACFVSKNTLPARVNQHVAIIRCKPTTCSPYVFYYLQYLKPYLLKICRVGGTRNALTKDALEALNIITHPRPEHRAQVLSTLDAKIELNNRTNAELQALAKLIYSYWFVQFDFPNKNGKPYKSSRGKMVWNNDLKREIPEGWGAAMLSSISLNSTEQINPADTPAKVFKYYSIPTFDATGSFGLEKGASILSNKFTVKTSDILVSKLNPWASRVIYPSAETDLICSTEFVVWRAPNNDLKNFLFMVACDPSFIGFCTASASGTSHSHKRVNPDVMMRYTLAYDNDTAEKLGSVLSPILHKLKTNSRENQELISLRDWLLPMLMNGQVKVK